jgi:hypothetical protein
MADSAKLGYTITYQSKLYIFHIRSNYSWNKWPAGSKVSPFLGAMSPKRPSRYNNVKSETRITAAHSPHCRTLPRAQPHIALPHIAANCRTAAHCHTAALLRTAAYIDARCRSHHCRCTAAYCCTAALPHCRTLPLAMAHILLPRTLPLVNFTLI